MLKLLSGTQHRVLTAVAVQIEGRVELVVSESRVTFGALDDARIAAYVASGEPFDKAGSYGIQGRAALSSSASRAAIPASWDCRFTRRPTSCDYSG
jgi:septum formation protein